MTRIAWITDPHLNFVRAETLRQFLCCVETEQFDAILLGGDVGEAPSVVDFLECLADTWQVPLHLVLGNHDFYFGGLHDVRQRVAERCSATPNLTYLTMADAPVALTANVGLIGHDGWADAREGDYDASLVMLNDYRLIEELANFSKAERRLVLHELGDRAAVHIERQLTASAERFSQTVLLTHVPPFREACWHQGRTSNDEWAPHFTCHAMGQVILRVMASYPGHQLTVLCGHTHSAGEARLADNVRVLTGQAVYGQPEITGVMEFS